MSSSSTLRPSSSSSSTSTLVSSFSDRPSGSLSNSSNDKKNTNKNMTTSSTTTSITLPRVIAIVFPQHHQDPLNDKLWGIGFTDWTNLASAPEYNRLNYSIPRPLMIENGGLGYYDYTDIDTRKKQGEIAKQYNIDGFMYHHYWFYDPKHPGPTLAQPLINMLLDGYPNIPFFFN